MLVIKIHPQLTEHEKGLCKMIWKAHLQSQPHRSAYYLLNHTGILAIVSIPRDQDMTSLLTACAISYSRHAEWPLAQAAASECLERPLAGKGK